MFLNLLQAYQDFGLNERVTIESIPVLKFIDCLCRVMQYIVSFSSRASLSIIRVTCTVIQKNEVFALLQV